MWYLFPMDRARPPGNRKDHKKRPVTRRIASRSKALAAKRWPLAKQTLADWWEDKACRSPRCWSS